MRLPAERARLEWALRLVALAALVGLVIMAFTPYRPEGRLALSGDALAASLPSWSQSPPADTLSLVLVAPPRAVQRDWLVALRRGGTVVRWSDAGVPATMIDAEARRDPAGGVTVRLTGPRNSTLILRDGLGPLDGVRLGDRGSTVQLPTVVGHVEAALGRTVFSAVPYTEQPNRHVVVLGMAGWESKFVISALEERGWLVDARLGVAPALAVEQGTPFPLDTARHATVIALDSAAAGYAASIVAFVHSGGGVVLGPGAVRAPMLRSLAPGRGDRMTQPSSVVFTFLSPRRALAFRNLAPLVGDALALESRDGAVAVAARRADAGRVIEIGYEDTWRWRMEGGPAALAEHRGWWADLVSSVAYGSAPAGPMGDPAPRASLIDALGLPTPTAPTAARSMVWYRLLLGISVLGMFGEWISRRLRGVP